MERFRVYERKLGIDNNGYTNGSYRFAVLDGAHFDRAICYASIKPEAQMIVDALNEQNIKTRAKEKAGGK